MSPKKVFLTLSAAFMLLILACCITLATAKSTPSESKTEQSKSSTTQYELPKVVPVAWLTGV